MSDVIKSSEITDEKTYLNRRNFMRAGLLAGTTLATAGVYRFINPPPPKEVVTETIQDISRFENPVYKTEDKLNTFQERLHRLTYAAAIGGVVHFWLIVKSDVFYPLLFGLVLAGLLGYRIYAAYEKPKKKLATNYTNNTN